MRLKFTAIALTTMLIAGTLMQAQEPTTLSALRDHKRVLLIVAGAHDPRVEQQWSALVDNRTQATERDLVTIRLTPSPITMHDGNRPPEAIVSSTEEQAVRARFHIAADQFTVILIGKDGGEKLHSHQPIAWQTLQSTIDSMPMRQTEMRHTR